MTSHGVTATLIYFVSGVALAQPAPLRFEVASVRPTPPGTKGVMSGGPGTSDPTRIDFRGVWLKTLLVQAFALKRFQIVGPDWMDGTGSPMYDIAATLPPGATQRQFEEMLQNLIRERFKLELHHETRQFPVYELTVGSKGPKLKASDQARGGFRTVKRPGGWELIASGASMGSLARFLSEQLSFGVSVVDNTKLTGSYDFTVQFADERSPAIEQDEPLPSLATALQQDLGLVPLKKTAPFDVLVIDHVEKTPTEN